MLIDKFTRILVLTGAGISAESGLKTFRDSGGLWENHSIEEVATPEAFIRNPEMVWRFYKMRYEQAVQAKPNQGHYALAELEKRIGSNFTLITQNVDELHQRAGNKRVFEMHGSLSRCFCVSCFASFSMMEVDIKSPLPYCPKCESLLRPDIVWFGEVPYYLEEIDSFIRLCDIFIVIGTSGSVFPAAGLVITAKYKGAKTIAINLDKPENIQYFNEFYQGKSGDVLPELINSWTYSL